MLEEQRTKFKVVENRFQHIEIELKRVADMVERCNKTMGIVVDKK